ncbi:MAG: PPOX class F420-dependent oxidoreductase [Thermomicrobiales bacterium]
MTLTASQREFLDQPAYLRLATLMPDGSPQITVLWYRLDGEELHVVCPESAQKVVNLDNDPRVSAVVEAPSDPYKYIELRGTCEAVRDDGLARQDLRKIAERYIGDRSSEFVDGLSNDPRVLLRITPTKVRSYG